MRMLLLATLGICLLSACAGGPPPEPAPPPLPQPVRCAAIESRNWEAWVDRMPGPDARATLHVAGEIVLPTPGYQITLREGAADRSATPLQQLILELTPPAGMVAQVITTASVRYEGAAIAQRYRGVAIVCAGRQLARIHDIPDAH